MAAPPINCPGVAHIEISFFPLEGVWKKRARPCHIKKRCSESSPSFVITVLAATRRGARRPGLNQRLAASCPKTNRKEAHSQREILTRPSKPSFPRLPQCSSVGDGCPLSRAATQPSSHLARHDASHICQFWQCGWFGTDFSINGS